MHVHNSPLGLGEVFDCEEMFEKDLEGDPVGGVFEDDPGCDPVGDFIACPHNLQIFDIEDHCWLLCQIFVETYICAFRSKNLSGHAGSFFVLKMRSNLSNTVNCLEIMHFE